jgi:hypothetical protein
MDFDVFGPVDNKVVILGEDNVVIVTSKEAERASNEEIPQAISELKIEPSDSNAEPLSPIKQVSYAKNLNKICVNTV